MNFNTRFDGLIILIPGYALDDISAEIPEEQAAGLLHAFAFAWHPLAQCMAPGIPVLRQADPHDVPQGNNLLLIPEISTEWLGHDWRELAESGGGTAVVCGEERNDVRNQLVETLRALQEDSDAFLAHWEAKTESESADRQVTERDFLAFGTAWLFVSLLSRRMHHFHDPDEAILNGEFPAAAEAWVEGEDVSARQSLQACYDALLHARELCYPVDFWLVDLCIPGTQTTAEELTALARQFPFVHLLLNGDDLQRLVSESPDKIAALREALLNHSASATTNSSPSGEDGDQVDVETDSPALSTGVPRVIGGHQGELRTALASLPGFLSDLDAGAATYSAVFQQTPVLWGRRRFGLASSLPRLLRYYGFEFALHFALDDGVYPERESALFQWYASGSPMRLSSGSGNSLPATSRIPVAIDSAAAFLSLADRCTETMQQDHHASLFFARLPELQTPWLEDLLVVSRWSPVYGRFVHLVDLAEEVQPGQSSQSFKPREYLSASLIQSSVIKHEQPCSGPGGAYRGWELAEAARFAEAVAGMTARNEQSHYAQVDLSEESGEATHRLSELERSLLINDATASDPLRSTDIPLSPSRSEILDGLQETMRQRVGTLASWLRLQPLVSDEHSCDFALLVLNPLPFARRTTVFWPAERGLPHCSEGIVAVGPAEAVSCYPSDGGALSVSAEVREVVVDLPPGGIQVLREGGESKGGKEFNAPAGDLPLGEEGVLRNRWFELELNARTGGIAGLRFHGERLQRLSQMVCFRFERPVNVSGGPDAPGEETETRDYADLIRRSVKLIRNTPLSAAVQTEAELRHPTSGEVLAVVRQTTEVDRYHPRVRITVSLNEVHVAAEGNPWECYYGCRFAWDNEAAVLTRSVLGQAVSGAGERFEAPEFIELADDDHQITIVPLGAALSNSGRDSTGADAHADAGHGVVTATPYHRRSGPRMLDSILLPEGEKATTFRFDVWFDGPLSSDAAVESGMDPITLPVSAPETPRTDYAWLFGRTEAGVRFLRPRWVCLPETVDPEFPQIGTPGNSQPALRITLAETEGRAVKTAVRTIRPAAAAWKTDATGGKLTPLTLAHGAPIISLDAYGLQDILLTF